MIELREVSKVFNKGSEDEVIALQNVSFQIKDGETIALIGTSGCGKTTTLRLINRLEEPTSGSVFVDGVNVQSRDLIELRRHTGYVIQTGGLFPHMTVADNIGLLCTLEGWEKEVIDTRVDELLRLVNMEPGRFRDRYPGELSGGQCQRIGVARALVLDPKYILMDEPFGALDPITRSRLHEEFLDLQEKVQKTVVLVTHDMNEAFHLATRVAIMKAGKIIQCGTPDELRNHPINTFVETFVESCIDGRG